MTFLQLQDDALRALNHSTSASSDPRTRVKGYINLWHRRLLTRPGFTRLLRDHERTFDSVASQPVYGLTYPMGRINGIHDRTNDIRLVRRDLAWIRRQDPGLDVLGQPEVYAERGWFSVQQHPSAASSIFIIATAAATNTAQWELLLADGTSVSGTTALNGTTAVQLGTASTVVQIARFFFTAALGASVTATIRQTSGTGTVLGTVLGSTTRTRYLHIQLWPTPQSATTYYVDYTREIVDIVEDLDEPLLPPDFHHILSLGAQHDEWRRMDDDRAADVRQDLEVELRNLNAWLWDLADATDDQGGRMGSRLGAWYPADRWGR